MYNTNSSLRPSVTPDTSSMNLSGIYFRRLHEVQRAHIRGNIIIIIIINIIIIGRLTSNARYRGTSSLGHLLSGDTKFGSGKILT